MGVNIETIFDLADDDYDDWLGGSAEYYEEQSKEHFKWLKHISKCNDEKAYYLLNKFKENLFACEFVDDEEAEMLYHTFISWKEQVDNFLADEERKYE